MSPAQQPLGCFDAKPTFVEPIDAPHRHGSGFCLKGGSLTWFFKPFPSLDCSPSPPHMHCHDGRR